MVDTLVLGTSVARRRSSSLLWGTNWMFSTAVVQQLDTLRVSGSIPLTSTTKAPMDKLVKSSLSKGEVVLCSNQSGGTILMPWWRNWHTHHVEVVGFAGSSPALSAPVFTEYSAAWQRTCMGCKGSQVRILLFRPTINNFESRYEKIRSRTSGRIHSGSNPPNQDLPGL